MFAAGTPIKFSLALSVMHPVCSVEVLTLKEHGPKTTVMKKVLTMFCLLITSLVYAQVAVNTTGAAAHPSAMLDVSSGNKGLLVPSISLGNTGSTSPVSAPATGLLVWNTNASVTGGNGIGFYYWSGSKWQSLLADNSGWKLGGNAGTNPAIHFLGTSDNQPLLIKVNNTQAGKIDHVLQNVFLGADAGINNTPTGRQNSFVGDSAGVGNTTGRANSFFGREAGRNNTTGNSNAFYGYLTGQLNEDGLDNTFIGTASGLTNTSGNYNTFIGSNTGVASATGHNNTMLGAFANVSADNLTNASAIGYGARVAASNSMVLGSINGVGIGTADVKVGIGTTAPANKLHVVNNNAQDGGWADGIVIENTSPLATVGEAGLSFRNAALPATRQWTVGMNQNPQLAFSYGTNFTGPLTRMAIDTFGNVGVGTIAPEAKFDVNGTAKLGTNGTVLTNIIKTTVNVDLDGSGGLLAGASFTTFVTVPNAQPGASVLISPQFALIGSEVISYARVSTANTVEIKVTNASEGFSVNHAAMDVYITLIQ